MFHISVGICGSALRADETTCLQLLTHKRPVLTARLVEVCSVVTRQDVQSVALLDAALQTPAAAHGGWVVSYEARSTHQPSCSRLNN